ncbi:GIY-YIG nuclease family protein [Jatrophihabitans sp.]|uniref:GIY-YIG nuclease family protein n=1 Tax=Jatrophihabitans sp. TaxID=1932789 RepID=UPI0030C782BC
MPTGYTKSRLVGGRMLGTRAAAAGFANRHVNTIRRYCVPVACDVGTRADLYDLDRAMGQFQTMSSLCVIPDGAGDACGSPIMRNAPVPVCSVHGAVISEFFSQQDMIELARATLMAQQEAAPSPRLPDNAPRSSVVYYVQLDAIVKIGTTIDLAQRLRAYPPHARLLVTEPGGYTLERKRLRQFNEYLRAGHEWFDPGPRLREHIEKLMAASAAA